MGSILSGITSNFRNVTINGSTEDRKAIIPTIYFLKLQKRLIENLSKLDHEPARVFIETNEKILNLLIRIDCWAEGDKVIKLFVFQDWAETLMKFSFILANNLQNLQTMYTQSIDTQQQQTRECNELQKCKRDLKTLTKYIAKAHKTNVWETSHLNLESAEARKLLRTNFPPAFDSHKTRNDEYNYSKAFTDETHPYTNVESDFHPDLRLTENLRKECARCLPILEETIMKLDSDINKLEPQATRELQEIENEIRLKCRGNIAEIQQLTKKQC